MQALEVRRVPISLDLAYPGDYVFVPKKKPLITEERVSLASPGFFRRMFGKTYEVKQTVLEVWPKIDTIIINCPTCNSPCATTSGHKILSVEPLTLEIPLTCPYCKDVTFVVKEGKLIPA